MPFIVRNSSNTTPFHLLDQYLDLIIAADEHVDLEQVFAEDSLYMSSVNPNALYTAIQNEDIVRRNDADDTDIAAVNAFDDAIWRWSPTRQQKEALVGRPVEPSSVNKYLTQGVFSLKATVSGTARWGDIVLVEGTNITIADDGLGSFTISASATPSFAAPVTLVPDGGNVEGTATSASRSDHKHDLPAATAVSVTTSNAEGTSTSISRADHMHQGIHSLKATTLGTARYGDIVFLEGSNITITDDGAGNFTIAASGEISIPFGTPVALVPDGGNVEGTSTNSARADHKHDLPADTAVSVTTSNAEGTSTSISRADHMHQGIHSLKANAGGTARYGDLVLAQGTNITITDDGLGTFTIAAASISYGSPLTLVPDGGNVDGTSTSVARADHKHDIPADTAVSVTTSNAEGTSTSISRADHMHQGIHSLKATATGTARYGDIVFLEGTNISISDDGAGNFTFASSESYGTPVTLIPDGGNVEGTATTVSRSDHKHDLPADTAVTIIPDGGNAEGTSTSVARADHKHDLPADTAISVTTANAEGTSTSISRADHAHQGIHSLKANSGGTARYGDLVFLAGTNVSITDDGAGNFTFASSESYGTPVTLVPDGGNVEGTATTVSRSDHKHDIPADTAVTIVPDGGNAEGTSTSVARADHKHDLPAATPVSIGTTNAEGTSTSVARADHVHSGSTFLTGNVKAGVLASTDFTGNPKKATVTFASAFSSTSYSITVTGVDARTWAYESKTTGGFVINANANAALTSEVSWKAALSGS